MWQSISAVPRAASLCSGKNYRKSCRGMKLVWIGSSASALSSYSRPEMVPGRPITAPESAMRRINDFPSAEFALCLTCPLQITKTPWASRLSTKRTALSLDFSQEMSRELYSHPILYRERGLVAPASRRRFCAAMEMQKSPAGRWRHQTPQFTPKCGTINPITRIALSRFNPAWEGVAGRPIHRGRSWP